MEENIVDYLIKLTGVKNDAALAKLLDVDAPAMSKIRNGMLGIGDIMLLRLHEETGISTKELKHLIFGDSTWKTRKSHRV